MCTPSVPRGQPAILASMAKRKVSKEAGRRLRPVTSSIEWIGGMFTGIGYVENERESYRPWLVMWTDGELILAAKAVEPDTKDDEILGLLVRALHEAREKPQRIRVSDGALASNVRFLVGDEIHVEVAPTPEIDDLARSYQAYSLEHPVEDGASPSYLREGRVDPAVVKGFFVAAAAYFRRAPWKTIGSDDALFSVDAPTVGLHAAPVTVLGGLGENFGFVAFDTIGDFDAFREAGASADERDEFVPPIAGCLSVTFEREDRMSTAIAHEIRTHRWTLAGPKAYPALLVLDSDGLPRPADTEDFVRAWTVCEALTAFVTWFRPRGLDDAVAVRRERHISCAKIPGTPDVTVTLPHPEMAPNPQWITDRIAEYLGEHAARSDTGGPDLGDDTYVLLGAILAFVELHGAPPLARWLIEDVEVFLLEFVPEMIELDVGETSDGPDGLAMWFRWLAAHGSLANGEPLARACEDLADAFVDAMHDEERAGPMKILRRGLRSMGIDPTDPEGPLMPMFIEGDFEHANALGWSGPGPSSPCPCGSGKSFVHCHGSTTKPDKPTRKKRGTKK